MCKKIDTLVLWCSLTKSFLIVHIFEFFKTRCYRFKNKVSFSRHSYTVPRREYASGEAKSILDVLDNDTKQISRKASVVKVWFQNIYGTIVPLEFEATLRGKCPNTEFFMVRIQENMYQKKLCIWTLLTQCNLPIYCEVSQYTAENIGGYSKAVARRKIVHTEFFLVCIFPYLNWIRRFTS